MDSSLNSSLTAYAHSLLRIVFGFLFVCHSLEKLFGLFGGIGGTGAKAPVGSLFWFSGIVELGGFFILFGLFTRVIAFILSGEMAAAYFMIHVHNGFWPINNGGELAVIYCFLFLYFAASGAGLFSLDHALWGKAEDAGAAS